MTEYNIAGYKIESQTLYNSLNSVGIDSADTLKKLDINSDMTICEDELVEYIEQAGNVEETTENDNEDDNEDDDNSQTSTSSSSTVDYESQIEYYDQQNVTLEGQLNQLYSQLGTCKDSEELQSVQSQIENIRNQISSNENAIYNILVKEENQKTAAVQQASGTTSTSSSSSLTTGAGISGTTDFGSSIVSIAKSYVGKLNETDGSYLQVTGGRAEHWCADFVTYVVSQAASETGTSLNGFGSPAVANLKAWGQANNCYTETTYMSASEKAQWIANNVQPGDVMIMQNNASHTGIVTKVYSDGSFDTVEGNTSDQCLERHYSASEAQLSGFIDIT